MFPSNVFPDTAEIDGQGRLVIGGCSTLDLAEEYGTPVYVLGRSHPAQSLPQLPDRVRAALPRRPGPLRLQGLHQSRPGPHLP